MFVTCESQGATPLAAALTQNPHLRDWPASLRIMRPTAGDALPACSDSEVLILRLDHARLHLAGHEHCITADDRAEFARGALAAQRQSLAARALLRRALSAAVDEDVPPRAWRFTRSAYGKPLLADELPMLHFSTTHARGVSLIALSRHSRVGIDAEAYGVDDWRMIADSMFNRRERAILNSVPQSAREEAFLRLWTAKEAHAKLVGTGLAFDAAADDCGPGTHLATWLDESPSARVIVTLAVNHTAEEDAAGEGEEATDNRRQSLEVAATKVMYGVRPHWGSACCE